MMPKRDGWQLGQGVGMPTREVLGLINRLLRRATMAKANKSATQTTQQGTNTGGGLAQNQGRMLIQSPGLTDFQITSCDDVSAEALMTRPDLQKPVTQAVREQIQLEKVQTNLKLSIQRKETVRLGIKERIKDMEVAQAAFDYSAQASNTLDSRDNAEYQETKRLLNANIRKNKGLILQGEADRTKVKGAIAQARSQAYQETYQEVNFENLLNGSDSMEAQLMS